MKQNCVTTTFDRLHRVGGRFVAAACRRSPLMHVWHEAADGTVTRYEPDRRLRHWSGALFGYPGHVTHTRQVAARPMTLWQIVASAWVLAWMATGWALWRAVRSTRAARQVSGSSTRKDWFR